MDHTSQAWGLVGIIALVLLIAGAACVVTFEPRHRCEGAHAPKLDADTSKVPKTKGPVSVTGRGKKRTQRGMWWL